MQGRLRVDLDKNYMTVAIAWGPFCGCLCNKSPITVYIRAPGV